jgi:drug/metabolite transporter (DMT)-like permease
VAAAALALRAPSLALTTQQWLTLLYLGVGASGLGFFLWNVGATRVAPATLAVMNNAKVPLGVAASIVVFGEAADLNGLLAGFALLGAALWLAVRAERSM